MTQFCAHVLRTIETAKRALVDAGPDDIRHGYTLSLHGLLVLKDIERNHRGQDMEAIHTKVARAVRYLTHGIYLLARSEDFWGTQEACWNLAYALYRLGNLPLLRFPDATGFLGHDNQEILNWIELSSEIIRIHNTGNDSLRNFVLRASVHMTRTGKLDAAEQAFHDAYDFLQLEQEPHLHRKKGPNRSTSRELGRLYEQQVYYFLMQETMPGQNAAECRRAAAKMYRQAREQWKSDDLKSLLENELVARYDYDEHTKTVRLRGNSSP
jgi:hypothetical protein